MGREENSRGLVPWEVFGRDVPVSKHLLTVKVIFYENVVVRGCYVF